MDLGLPTEIIINFDKTPMSDQSGKIIINVGGSSSVPAQAQSASPFAKLAQIPSKIEGSLQLIIKQAEQKIAILEMQLEAAVNAGVDAVVQAAKEATLAAEQAIMSTINQIKAMIKNIETLIDNIKSFFGSFPVSYNTNSLSKYKDVAEDWFKRITAAIKEYTTFVIVKIIQFLNSLIPESLEINILGLDIDLVKFFTDGTYFQQKKTEIAADINNFVQQLDAEFRSFSSYTTGKAVDFEKAAQAFMENLFAKCKEYIVNLFQAVIEALVKLINSCDPCMKIISALKIPTIVDPTVSELDIMIKVQLAKVGNCAPYIAQNITCPFTYSERLDALEDLKITLLDYVGVPEIYDIRRMYGLQSIDNPRLIFGDNVDEESIYQYYIDTMHNFVADWKFIRYQMFLQEVSSQIDKIADKIAGLSSVWNSIKLMFNSTPSDIFQIALPKQITIPIPSVPAVPTV